MTCGKRDSRCSLSSRQTGAVRSRFADTKEVWHFEIYGPGRGKIGAVWAAYWKLADEVAEIK